MLTGRLFQLFMADTESKFSEKIGWVIPESGGRAARYAIVIDHGKVVYAEKEAGREIKVGRPMCESDGSCLHNRRLPAQRLSFRRFDGTGRRHGTLKTHQESEPI